MGQLEDNLNKEADKKGLTGKEKQQYIGGTIHKLQVKHSAKKKKQEEKQARRKKPPDFKPHINRFNQHVTKEDQEKRYHQVLADLEKEYGPGETYKTELHAYKTVPNAKGKGTHLEKYVSGHKTMSRRKTAQWFAEHGY